MKASLALLALLLTPLPAQAVPETGLYVQALPGGVANLQTVAHHGAIQIDYIPTLARPDASGPMQLLQAAARVPVPLLESALTVRGLLGYRQQWAFYNGEEDTYGGIDAGVSTSLNLGDVPFIGEFVAPFSLYAYGFENWLVTAKSQGRSFGTNNLLLPSFGYGFGYELPTKGRLYIGIEHWSIPVEIGSGQTSFSNGVRSFMQYVVGYRW